jgi:hypothetical protein
MKRVMMLCGTALTITYAASAAADPPNLKGAYGFTGSDACLTSLLGFNTRFQAIDGRVFSGSGNVEGVRRFNGDGTGTVTGSSMGITVPPTPGFQPDAASNNFTLSFTYTVNADGTWTATNVPGTDTGTILTGPRAGQTFKRENVATATGLISRDGKTLTSANLEPKVEILTFSNLDVHPQICHRSRVYIKLDDAD